MSDVMGGIENEIFAVVFSKIENLKNFKNIS
jgi:hypothetical protein